jgi:hypothetical protein
MDINIKDGLLKVRQHVGAATLLKVLVTGIIYFRVVGSFFVSLFECRVGTIRHP